MTTQYKTQCPRCQTIYPMPDEKLDQPKARANCGKCHHIFFLNSHLIKSDPLPKPKPTPPRPKPTIVPPTPAVPTPEVSAQEIIAEARAKHQANLEESGQTISAKSSETLSKLAKGEPIAPPAPKFDFDEANDIFADDDEPQTPKTEPLQDSFDGLDDFLNGDLDIAPPVVESASNKNPTIEMSEEEKWASELLKEAEKPTTVSAINRPTDDMSDIFGSAFDDIPTVSATASLDKETLQKKAQARLASQSPSQESLITKRGIVGQFLWFFSCVVMVAMMVGQYLAFHSDAIIKRQSSAKPLLEMGCGLVKCQLPKADLTAFSNHYEIQIANDLSANLIGTITNTSGHNQLYPNLKISLMSGNDVIGEFVAGPNDYLVNPQRLLASNQGKRYMFTLKGVSPAEITRVEIKPFYVSPN